MNKKLLIFALVLVLSFGTIISVYATTAPNGSDGDDEVVLLDGMMSQTEATVYAVEVNPDAVFVELGDENGTIIYEFETVDGVEVKVNAIDGTILPDDNEHEDLDDADDSDDDSDDDQIEHEFDGEEEHED